MTFLNPPNVKGGKRPEDTKKELIEGNPKSFEWGREIRGGTGSILTLSDNLEKL